MNGHNVFNHIVENVSPLLNLVHITKEEYELFRKDFTWDALHGIRYGQSFCNRFNITDNLLYYDRDYNRCDEYIRKNYVRRI